MCITISLKHEKIFVFVFFFVCHRCYNHRKKREKKKLYHQETNHSPRTYKKGTEQLKSIWILVYQCITRTSFNFDHVRTTTTHISFILFFFPILWIHKKNKEQPSSRYSQVNTSQGEWRDFCFKVFNIKLRTWEFFVVSHLRETEEVIP